MKEKEEAVAAVEVARSERKRWDEEKDARCEDRDARERNRQDMPFRDPRKSVLQKLRASNLDPDDPSSVLHPALPIAFFAKICKSTGGVGIEPTTEAFLTPRRYSTMPNKGVAIVLASDHSRYEGDWHHMGNPSEDVLKLAFDTACAAGQVCITCGFHSMRGSEMHDLGVI